MIQADMKQYNYYLLSASDGYGQPTVDYSKPSGTVLMSINILSQGIIDNILYSDCSYLGLTTANISDKYVIEYSDQSKLKVQYINPKGKYKQVYLKRM